MSRRHVLALTTVMPELPPTLAKTLFLLAVHADHRTGLSRPGRTALKAWRVTYPTWHRHLQHLTRPGLVKQVVWGNAETGKAADYQLLYLPRLTDETPSVPGEGVL